MAEKIKVILDLQAQTQDLKSKVSDIQNQLKNVKMPGLSQNLTGDLQRIQERIKSLQEIADNPISLKSDLGKTEKEVDRVSSSFQSLLREVEQLKNASDKDKLKLLPDDQQQKIKKAEQALTSYTAALGKEVKKTTELINAEKKLEKARKAQSTASTKKVIAPVTAIDQQQTLKELEKQQKEAEALVNQKRAEYEKAGHKMNERGKYYKQDTVAQGLVANYEKATKAVEDYRKKIAQTITQSDLDKITVDLQEQQKVVNDLTLDWDKMKTKVPQDAFNELRASADKLGVSLTGIGTDATPQNIQLLETRLQELKTSGLAGVNSELTKLQNELRSTSPSLDAVRAKVDEGANEWNRQKEALDAANRSAQDLANLKNQVLDFFSVTGAIQLFRRAIQSAFDTVKELDSAMTEIAVVSDFSVNDMWGQLPKFTDQANELGMAIKDTYEATTLFVQQGLDLDNSMKLATETLKMAAVAGMDAADATDALTAAIRGFGMAIDETSAKRINDVYSELAAITASDVQEISTAMSKTASIAHSVNMEFETTAAFLAQGIESTREAAETI